MTKIYEALRRHEQQPPRGQPLLRQSGPGDGVDPGDGPQHIAHQRAETPELDAPLADESGRFEQPEFVARSPLASNLFIAQREMQALYRSVAPLVADQRTGRMIMFSSAHGGEGKTTVCGSYAATLAQSFGKSVLILDADRGHALTGQWGSHRDAIVTTLASESATVDLSQAGHRVGTHGVISVVPVGSSGADSQDLVLIGKIKERLARAFDYVLIDGRALADLSNSPAMAAIADGVVLVVQAERTRWPVALNARREFEASGARVMGVFLNRRRFYIPPRIYRHI